MCWKQPPKREIGLRVMGMAFDLNNPPADPAPDCPEPDRYREAYAEYRKHQPNPYGRCALLVCAQTFPCMGHQLALRALIDACTPRQPLPNPDVVGTQAVCRSVGRSARTSRVTWPPRHAGRLGPPRCTATSALPVSISGEDGRPYLRLVPACDRCVVCDARPQVSVLSSVRDVQMCCQPSQLVPRPVRAHHHLDA
jgi:hypothetical protein